MKTAVESKNKIEKLNKCFFKSEFKNDRFYTFCENKGIRNWVVRLKFKEKMKIKTVNGQRVCSDTIIIKSEPGQNVIGVLKFKEQNNENKNIQWEYSEMFV